MLTSWPVSCSWWFKCQLTELLSVPQSALAMSNEPALTHSWDCTGPASAYENSLWALHYSNFGVRDKGKWKTKKCILCLWGWTLTSKRQKDPHHYQVWVQSSRTLYYFGVNRRARETCWMVKYYFIREGCGGNGQAEWVNLGGECKICQPRVRWWSQAALVVTCGVGWRKSDDPIEPACLKISKAKKVLINYH